MTDLEFLRGYAVGLALALLIAAAGRILVRAPHRDGSCPPDPIEPISPDELAYLRGGPYLVVESAVARLIDRGHLRVHSTGALRVAGGAAGSGPVDQTVVRAASRPDVDTVTTVIDLVTKADAVSQLRDRLVRKGLLVDVQTASIRVRHALLPLGLLFAAGVVRWVDGVGDGRADGGLAVALVATAIAGRLLLTVRSGPTFLGARVLAERAGRAPLVPARLGRRAP